LGDGPELAQGMMDESDDRAFGWGDMMAKLHDYQDCTAELTRTLIGVITARAVNPNVETMLAQNVPNGTNDAAIEFSSARTDRSPNLLPRAKAPARQTYVYKTVGDCKIHADVFRPADQQPRPVILWLHGGAFIWGSRARIREEQLARYIQEGFVVVAIDYRLAPETKLPAILDDLKDAYEWIRKSGPILFQADPDRVIVVGHSAGGYLALMGGVVLTPPPFALVSFYGYGDISGDWCNQPDVNYSREPAVSESAAWGAISSAIITEASHSKRWPFYLYCRQRGSWAREVLGEQADVGRFCPVRHVTKAFPPTLLLHGDCDTDVPYEQSVKMAEALRSQAVPCEFITLTNHGHAFDSAGDGMRDPLVADAFERVIRFVKDRAGRQASVIAPRSVSQFNEMAHRAIETNAQASGVEPSRTEGKPK
jgi:acetyl esterase/lipase